MDTEYTFEHALDIIYHTRLLQYSGTDVLNFNSEIDVFRILQTCLLVTVGDTVKLLTIDSKGNIVQKSMDQLNMHLRDNFIPLNSEYAAHQQGGVSGKNEAQFLHKQHMAADTAQAVIYAVETDQHGLYEVRLHRLAHLDNKNILELVTKEGKISAFEEASRLFE